VQEQPTAAGRGAVVLTGATHGTGAARAGLPALQADRLILLGPETETQAATPSLPKTSSDLVGGSARGAGGLRGALVLWSGW
jgi:hypothetical protein